MSCDWQHGIGTPRLFHIEDNVGLEALCAPSWSRLPGDQVTVSVAGPPCGNWCWCWPMLPLLTWLSILPQRTWVGSGFAFYSRRNVFLLPRSWVGKAASSLMTALDCQAPVHDHAFSMLNGRKRWCVGNTLCCQRRGTKAECHLHTLFHAALPSEGCSQKCSLKLTSSPCFCWCPLLWQKLQLWVWMNHKSRTALGCICCTPLLSAPLAVNSWSYSLPCPLPRANLENRSLSSWELQFSVTQKYTSRHASHVTLLLLPILEGLCLPSPCLILWAGVTFWKQAVPWAVSYGLAWMHFVSAELQAPFKAILHEQGNQSSCLLSGFPSV